MSVIEYNKALKVGDKEYKSAIAKGQHPYLPVLDEILSHVDVESQVSLGLVQVPLSQIVGTYSSGRTTAFARNFMPILESGSEFASKWSSLYDELVEEGLRDPIKAYEYNNKFYVMEGNKRVSCLKFMDSVSIEAYVTRVIPKKNEEDPENRLYYEFLDFYNLTGINYVNVTKEGVYKKLLVNTGHDLETVWSKDDEQDFHSLYTFFEQEFHARAQDKLSIGAGDALASYLEIYDYDEVKDKSTAELKKDVSKLWNEFLMINTEDEVRLVLSPTEESKKQHSFAKLFPVGAPVLKIAFIHDKSKRDSGWTYSHELGRKYVQDVFGDKIDTTCIEMIDDERADEVFNMAIESGCKLIFATSPKLCQASVKAAIEHPDIKILNCSMMLNHKYIRSYYLRMYEAKYISGAIAGSLLEGDCVGYVADYPIRGSMAEINAFALGVQMTNPKAKVLLGWRYLKNNDHIAQFKKKNATIVCGAEMNAAVDSDKEFGMFKFNDDGSHQNLCMPVRHWGKLYEEIIQSVMIGAYKNDDSLAGANALNYFWGMSSGAVDVIYSRNLSAGSVRLLRTLREGVKNMDISPFTGPIFSQDGVCRCEDGKVMTPEECVEIDWLADNIEGYIPEISELEDEAIELVKLQGIKQEELG